MTTPSRTGLKMNNGRGVAERTGQPVISNSQEGVVRVGHGGENHLLAPFLLLTRELNQLSCSVFTSTATLVLL